MYLLVPHHRLEFRLRLLPQNVRRKLRALFAMQRLQRHLEVAFALVERLHRLPVATSGELSQFQQLKHSDIGSGTESRQWRHLASPLHNADEAGSKQGTTFLACITT